MIQQLDENCNSDLLDAMADRAYELEEAMREADQSEFQFIEPMEDFHDDQS